VDIDQDGHVDIVSGSYSRMEKDMAGLFQVLYGQSGGKFKAAQPLKGTDGQPLIIPAKGEEEMTKKICTRQFITDWNGDGKLDIVTGNFEGTFFWFKGDGKGKFDPKPEPINQGGKPLKLPTPGHHSDPFVIDWDGDGDLDLLSGSTDAGVYLAENTAGTGKVPELKGFKALINPPGKEWSEQKIRREDDVKRPNYATRVWADDVNGDGKLDLFVGDNTTLSFPKEGLSEAEVQKKQAEWDKKQQAAMSKYTEVMAKFKDRNKPTEEEMKLLQPAMQEMSKLRTERAKFITEEMTGFVWLYLQK
jgi:hypothetical protein